MLFTECISHRRFIIKYNPFFKSFNVSQIISSDLTLLHIIFYLFSRYMFLNRKDWMVKINGQRVEPGETEAIIKNTDGIADAAIKDFKNQYGQVYLVAYYVENEPVDPQDIKSDYLNIV